MENKEFQCRDETLFVALFGISEIQYSNATNKINNIIIETIFTRKTFSIEILSDKFKTVVMGDKGGWVWTPRKIIDERFFGNFGLSRLWCNEQNQRVLTSMLLYKCYFSAWIHDGGIQTCSGWRIQFWKWSEIKKDALLGNFVLSRHCIPLQGTQVCNFLSENLSSTRISSCSFGEIFVRKSRKIKIKKSFLEVSDYQDTDAWKKNNDFSFK